MAFLAICWAVYRWLRRRIGYWAGILFLTGVSLPVFYSLYTALHPLDEFYKDKYEQITLHPFPASVRIINKDASYPSLPQGHYQACALIQVAPQEYRQLQQHLAHNSQFSPHSCVLDTGSEYYRSQSFEKVAGAIPCSRYAYGYAQKDSFQLLYIGLLNDGKSIVMYRFSI
ncbi:hypothetical protein [Hymenobacter rigui]|uniref:hypothetical protein n=1 Tax=Hymenobacter rigui TaxID=334424 RepID=UPI001477831A|nr:hypothetical protein [Hymenobacter rigui]